ncbi:hypothetical protein BT63DRAFT_416769 [Microthyrium microscopicum]|uniref:Myb-like transcription factor n=1 Tax=Microthyrium microscopicum TaxID=703497 RepID=A0A6A6U386_9PEZI|nr:hypothetical protein BT63DRAFT_416769 [Microthyrium microscopicum]
MSSPSSKRTLKPAPPAAPSEQTPFGLTPSNINQQMAIADPSSQLAVPGAASTSPISPTTIPRKRRASGQPAAIAPAIAPQPSPAQYGDPPVSAKVEASSADQGGQPATKKGRTNTPWTAAEEQRLKQMRDQGKSWSEIAKTFPNRTEGSVKKHWYKDMHYAEFDNDESQQLLTAIKEYEANKWKVIGQKLGKPAKACEQYAKQNFAGTK